MTCLPFIYETAATSCKEQELSLPKLYLGIHLSEIIFHTLKTARNWGPTGLTEEVRFWLSERDFGALLLVADITFWYFIKLPLGMAETKRFLHQGLFLSDFSSSLSLRSSVCRKSLMLYLQLDSRINYYEKDLVSLWNTKTTSFSSKQNCSYCCNRQLLEQGCIPFKHQTMMDHLRVGTISLLSVNQKLNTESSIE